MVFLGLPGEFQGKWFRAIDTQEAVTWWYVILSLGTVKYHQRIILEMGTETLR